MSGLKKPKYPGLLSRGSRVRATAGALFPKASIESRMRLLTEIRTAKECWPWMGCRLPTGYGTVWANGRKRSAHRVAYALKYGEPEPGAVIRHICSHPWCVNPRHLRAGTTADNMRDKVLAGRQAKGSKNGRAKLSEDDAREVVRRLQAGHRITYVARDFGVSRRACAFIRDGKNWAHIHAKPVQAALFGVAS